MNPTNSKVEKKIQLAWIIAIVAMFFHGKIPFMLPLSVVSALFVGIYLFWNNRNNFGQFKQSLFLFIKNSWTYLLLGVIFFLAVLFTANRDLLVLKENVYIVYIWILIAEFYFIANKSFLENYNCYFSRGYIFFLIVVLTGFYYKLLTTGMWFGEIFGIPTDYNYLALGLLIAVPLIVLEWQKRQGFWINLLGTLFLVAVFIPIFGSGSRRGFVLAFVVHLGLLLFWIKNFQLGKKTRVIVYYFSFLLLSFISIAILFGNASPQIRSLLIKKIFPNSQQKIKEQYTSISYRYSSIQNDTLTYQELFDKQWKANPFQAKGFGNRLVCRQLKSQLLNYVSRKEYDMAWQTLIDIRDFSESENSYLEHIPALYKEVVPTSFLLGDSLQFIPYIYPIPFLEKDFFDFSETQNLRLLSTDSQGSNRFLTFASLKDGEIFLKSNFVFVPQTENTILFDFKGIKANKLKINFFNEQNIEIILKEKVTDSILGNGFTRRQISFLTPFAYPKIGKITIRTDLSVGNKFEIGKNEHLRIPLPEKLQIKRAPIIDSQIREAVWQYVNKTPSIDSTEKINLFNFIINPSKHTLKFNNYGAFGRIISHSDSAFTAESPTDNNFSRISSKVPSLPGMIYNINFNIVSASIPVFYIKRYPEDNPFDFQLKEIQKSILPLDDGRTYSFSYQYKVEKSTSGFSLFVVGIQNASKFEKFMVSDLSFKLVGVEQNVGLTKVQWEFYRPILEVFRNESINNRAQIVGEISNYLAAKNIRIKRLTDLQTKNRLELLPLTEIQQDSIHQFITQGKAHPLKFRNYGANSIFLQDHENQQVFRVPENGIYTRAYTVLPAIINLEVNFECKFIGDSKPLVYTKRSPEINPYNFSIVKDKTVITQVGDSSYLINYQFQTQESNSGIGIIVIGYENGIKDKKFSIADAKYRLTQINDSSLSINSFQYTFLRRIINSEDTNAQANSVNGFANDEIMQWRDSLSSDRKLLDSRLQRWTFSVFYFNHFSFIKKLFGDGFTYLKVFPIVFPENGTNTGPDYPHNPIISAFLYSGILGGFFYIYFLGLSFYRYWQLRKELALFGIIYILAFAFTFFSGNSHFSVPAFTLLSLLPFAFPLKKKENISRISSQKQEISS